MSIDLGKIWADKVTELFYKKMVFRKSVKTLCEEYFKLSNRHWHKKRKLREEIANSALDDYLWGDYKNGINVK